MTRFYNNAIVDESTIGLALDFFSRFCRKRPFLKAGKKTRPRIPSIVCAAWIHHSSSYSCKGPGVADFSKASVQWTPISCRNPLSGQYWGAVPFRWHNYRSIFLSLSEGLFVAVPLSLSPDLACLAQTVNYRPKTRDSESGWFRFALDQNPVISAGGIRRGVFSTNSESTRRISPHAHCSRLRVARSASSPH